MAIAPDLSLRGRFAPVAISQYPTRSQESHRRKRNCLPEIATAPLGPRNDKSGNLAPRNHYCNTCNCQWRSMSALQGGNTYGTNSLAQCHQVCHCEEAAGRRGNLAVPDQITGKPSAKTQLPSRDCTPRALPRASRSGRHVGRWPPRNGKAGGFPHSSFFSLQDSFISVPLPCNTRLTALQNFPLSIFDFPRSPILFFSVFLYKYFRIESAKIRKKINKVRKYP